jgi:hypothetical protein
MHVTQRYRTAKGSNSVSAARERYVTLNFVKYSIILHFTNDTTGLEASGTMCFSIADFREPSVPQVQSSERCVRLNIMSFTFMHGLHSDEDRGILLAF